MQLGQLAPSPLDGSPAPPEQTDTSPAGLGNCRAPPDELKAREEAPEQVSPVARALGLSCLEDSWLCAACPRPCCDRSSPCRRSSFTVNMNRSSCLRNVPRHVAPSRARPGGWSAASHVPLLELRSLSPSCAKMPEAMVLSREVPGPVCPHRNVSPPRTTPRSKIFTQSLM